MNVLVLPQDDSHSIDQINFPISLCLAVAVGIFIDVDIDVNETIYCQHLMPLE